MKKGVILSFLVVMGIFIASCASPTDPLTEDEGSASSSSAASSSSSSATSSSSSGASSSSSSASGVFTNIFDFEDYASTVEFTNGSMKWDFWDAGNAMSFNIDTATVGTNSTQKLKINYNLSGGEQAIWFNYEDRGLGWQDWRAYSGLRIYHEANGEATQEHLKITLEGPSGEITNDTFVDAVWETGWQYKELSFAGISTNDLAQIKVIKISVAPNNWFSGAIYLDNIMLQLTN